MSPKKKEVKDEYVITVNSLSKTFKTKIKEPGVKGSLKAIFRPKHKSIHAVNNISFNVNKGELVAFIGPNGAGKSTTLKMLSGILFPDGGDISVLSLSPQHQRKQLAYNIGTVFGQKPQLWFHLPAMDSFNLFAKIYDLDMKEYKHRINHLIEVFQIQDIIKQPVRKLSLGQRMRCEFVLALIHKPKILFLDEPTIGLDVVIKKNIRELIKKINQEDKVTVILTSHDMGDVEMICKRMMIINHGRIVYDGTIDAIKKRYLKKKVITAVSDEPIKLPKLKGYKTIQKKRYAAIIEIDTTKLKIKQITNALMRLNPINDITIEEPPIEEIIENIYHQKR
ncbi:ATP-binding cassette domain-containing protein [Nanoarchaeota archaeon]